MFVRLVLGIFVSLGVPAAVLAQWAASGSKNAPQSQSAATGNKNAPQSQAALAEQLEGCRRHVIQLTEESRTNQKKLATLRNERKTLGMAGGEVARFKLANIDQEIREYSKQTQNAITQIESEQKRCDSLEAKISNASKPPPTSQGRKP